MADVDSITANSLFTTQAANTTSASGSINFTGLASGTDFGAVVDQLVKIESIQLQRMELWKASWEAKMTSMRSLNQRLEALEEAAAAMDTEAEFMVRQAATSDSTILTGSATSTSKPGAYQVTVGTDVKQVLQGAGLADASATVYSGAGTLSLEMNGATYNVVLVGTETLNDIRDAINLVTGADITATVVDDGTSSNSQHLVLTSNTGGSAGRITVTQSPLDFSLDSRDIVQEASTLGVGLSVAGQFTGDKADGSVAVYDFTVQNVTGGGVVGTDSFEISWTRTWDGGAPSAATVITVPADYTPGDSIEVEQGVYIQLDSGTVANGETFSVRAYANDIDDAEMGSWTGTSTVATEGNYQGAVNKTYTFTVMGAGSIDAGGTLDTITLRWTDSTGATGTVAVTEAGTAYEVDQGVKLNFTAGSFTSGDTFQVNVFSPILQQGQDKGLAQATKLVHAGFADTDISEVTSTAGTFSYTYGGKTIDVAVSAGKTLSQLVTLINEDEDNPGVTASILNDGQGLPDSYKLVLTGDDTGAKYQITEVHHDFTGTSFGSGGGVGGGFDRTQYATNAMIKVDGYPSEADEFLQRSSNEVDDVIGGVTLNLHNAGEAVITISTNTSAVLSQIEALVNAVNYAQDFIREETKYDSDTGEAGVLIGNYSYQILKTMIDNALNDPISGLTDGDDTFINLAQIGITTDPDNSGRWTIDQVALVNALNQDIDAVANLFIKNDAKGSTGVAARMQEKMEAATDSTDGTLNVLLRNYGDIVENIDAKIAKEEDRLELYRQRQTERFARLEATLSELNSIGSALESAIGQLPNSSSKD